MKTSIMSRVRLMLALVAGFLSLVTITAAPKSGVQAPSFNKQAVTNSGGHVKLAGVTPGGATNVVLIPIWVLGPVKDSPNFDAFVTNVIHDITSGTFNMREVAASPKDYVLLGDDHQVGWTNLFYSIGPDKLWAGQANPAAPFNNELGQIPWCFVVAMGIDGDISLAGLSAQSSSPEDPFVNAQNPGLSETQTILNTDAYDITAVGVTPDGLITAGPATRPARMVIVPFAPRLYNGGGTAAGRLELSNWFLGTWGNDFRIDEVLKFSRGGSVIAQATTAIWTRPIVAAAPNLTIVNTTNNMVNLQVVQRTLGFSYLIMGADTLSGTNNWSFVGLAGTDGKFTGPITGSVKFFKAITL